jgi:hypothetical protein
LQLAKANVEAPLYRRLDRKKIITAIAALILVLGCLAAPASLLVSVLALVIHQ